MACLPCFAWTCKLIITMATLVALQHNYVYPQTEESSWVPFHWTFGVKEALWWKIPTEIIWYNKRTIIKLSAYKWNNGLKLLMKTSWIQTRVEIVIVMQIGEGGHCNNRFAHSSKRWGPWNIVSQAWNRTEIGLNRNALQYIPIG